MGHGHRNQQCACALINTVFIVGLLRCMSPVMAVRPDGANHQWRRNPPGELSIDPVADERLMRVTAWVGAIQGAPSQWCWACNMPSLIMRRIVEGLTARAAGGAAPA